MTSPKTLLKAWNLRARKQLGQNFLLDPQLAGAIVARAGLLPSDTVVEIGAGLGSLTLPLARAVFRVHAIEKDPRLTGLLDTELKAAGVRNVEVVQGDVLAIDFGALAGEDDRRRVAVGNLPYNISSQIVLRLVRERRRFAKAVLMFQKELADRLMAEPGGRDYGRISVLLQHAARLRRLMTIEASHFFPRPKVASTVLEVTFRSETPLEGDLERLLFDTVRRAFSQRRKTLKNALSGGGPPGDVAAALAAAGIEGTRRAETLSVAEFVRLTRCLARPPSAR